MTDCSLAFAATRMAGVLGFLALAGCTFGPPPSAQARADAATVAACRQRAEQVYDLQNRGAIYSPNSSANTPASANYSPGTTDRGLADRYSRDTMINDCVRNTGAETDRGSAPGLRTTP